MVVSHLVVSWIQVAGLAVSLYGFFYLSTSVFPSSGISIFRPLLPASATGILGFIFGQVVDQNQDILALPPSWRIHAVYIGGISFILGYLIAFFAQPEVATPTTGIGRVINAILARLGYIVLALAGITTLAQLRLFGHTIAVVMGIALGLLVLLAFVIAIATPRLLSTHRLQIIGFIFSVLGILTGFLPSVLDVLGVTISQAR